MLVHSSLRSPGLSFADNRGMVFHGCDICNEDAAELAEGAREFPPRGTMARNAVAASRRSERLRTTGAVRIALPAWRHRRVASHRQEAPRPVRTQGRRNGSR